MSRTLSAAASTSFSPTEHFFKPGGPPPQRHFSGALGISIDEEGTLFVPDPANSRILKFNNHGRLVKSWPAPQKAVSPDERPSWVAAEPDNSVFVAYFNTGRIEKFSSDGAVDHLLARGEYPDRRTQPHHRICGDERICIYDGCFVHADSRLDDRMDNISSTRTLGANLGTIAAPQIAVTPHAELLVFDPSAPKVFRFRMHLENKEPQ